MNGRIKLAALGLLVVFAGGTCRERTADVAREVKEPAAPPTSETAPVARPHEEVSPPSAALAPFPVLQQIPAKSPTPERERPRATAARAAKTHIVPPIGRREAIERPIEDPPRLERQPPPLPELPELTPPLLAPPLMPPPLVLSALPDRADTPPPARASRSASAGLQAAAMGGVGIAGIAIGVAGAEMYQQDRSDGALALTMLGVATTVIGFTFSAVIHQGHEPSSPSNSVRAQRPVVRVGVGPATAFAGVTY
jgi:hypothetical protein